MVVKLQGGTVAKSASQSSMELCDPWTSGPSASPELSQLGTVHETVLGYRGVIVSSPKTKDIQALKQVHLHSDADGAEDLPALPPLLPPLLGL